MHHVSFVKKYCGLVSITAVIDYYLRTQRNACDPDICTVLVVVVVLLQPNFTLLDRPNKRLLSIKLQCKVTCYMLTDGQT